LGYPQDRGKDASEPGELQVEWGSFPVLRIFQQVFAKHHTELA
jgi:hypothetical protein